MPSLVQALPSLNPQIMWIKIASFTNKFLEQEYLDLYFFLKCYFNIYHFTTSACVFPTNLYYKFAKKSLNLIFRNEVVFIFSFSVLFVRFGIFIQNSINTCLIYQ